MKKFGILQELTECDTETQSQQMLLEKGADRLAWCGVATSLQWLKNTVAVKCNKVTIK